jgi:hypothetical protein
MLLVPFKPETSRSVGRKIEYPLHGSTTSHGQSVPDLSSAASIASEHANQRRNITPEAGHALEKLGHAIEYLADEFAPEGLLLSADNPQVEAIQILMTLNRQIYFECPVMPTIGERLLSKLRSCFSRLR